MKESYNFKHFTRRLFKSFLILFALLSFQSCNNGFEKSEVRALVLSEAIDIKEAQRQYEELLQIGDRRSNVRTKNDNTKKDKIKKKKIKWDKPNEYLLGSRKVTIVPFSLEEEIYHKLDDSSRVEYSNLSYFIVNKKGDKYDYEVVTKIPDLNFLSSSDPTYFSGKVIIEDIFGNFIKGYSFRDGKTYQLIAPDNRGARLKDQIYCTSVDWYSCASGDGGQSWTCSYSYTEYYCEGDPEPGGGDGFGIPGGFTPVGGGATPVYDYSVDFPNNIPFALCPPTTSFTKIGNAYYLKMFGIGLTAYNSALNKFINVDFPNTCFQIPAYMSQAQAAQNIANAINSARQKIDYELDHFIMTGHYIEVRNRFIKLVNDYLKLSQPGSTFSASACQGTINQATADYSC